MTRARAAVVCCLGAIACDPYPPHAADGARGALAGQPVCGIYPDDGFAQVAFDGGYTMEVSLPGLEDLWQREPAFLVWEDDAGCAYRLGGTTARVQYGGPIEGGYRPLFLEAIVFPVGEACSLCEPSACRTFDGGALARLYVWCGAPGEGE